MTEYFRIPYWHLHHIPDNMSLEEAAVIEPVTIANNAVMRYSGINDPKKIAEARVNTPIETTQQLVDLIKSAKPMKELAKKGHPAKQIFQALRIEVNDELGALEITVKDALKLLDVGGRLVIISFQSLEDRLVKDAFRDVTVVEGTRRNVFSLPKEEDLPKFRLVNRKIITPSSKELARNPRSHSAKLRAIERVKE